MHGKCAQCAWAGGSFPPAAGAEGGRDGADIAHGRARSAGGLPEAGSCLGSEALQSPFAGTSRAELKLWRQLCRKAAWNDASEHTLSLGDFCESSAESQPMAGGGQGNKCCCSTRIARFTLLLCFPFPSTKAASGSSHGWSHCL